MSAQQIFIDRLRAVARDCGYALAVHGSQQRDLDLIAAPWTVEAVSAQDLVDEICDAIPLIVIPDSPPSQPEMKPWGRLGWALAGCPRPWKYVDLSVAPRAGEAVPLNVLALIEQARKRQLAVEQAAADSPPARMVPRL